MDVLVPSEKRFEILKGGRQVRFQKGEINGCCKQPTNLYLADKDDRTRVTTWRCRVCGRAHRVMKAEPGMLGIVDLNAPRIGG